MIKLDKILPPCSRSTASMSGGEVKATQRAMFSDVSRRLLPPAAM
jgi:hypothetical protein